MNDIQSNLSTTATLGIEESGRCGELAVIGGGGGGKGVRDLSETSRGRGVETEGGSQLFETAEKGGVMKNWPLKGERSCKYVSVIM